MEDRDIIGSCDSGSSRGSPIQEHDQNVICSSRVHTTPVQWQKPELLDCNPLFTLPQKASRNKLDKFGTHSIISKASPRKIHCFSEVHKNSIISNADMQSLRSLKDFAGSPNAFNSKPDGLCNGGAKKLPVSMAKLSPDNQVHPGILREPTMFDMMHKFEALDT